MGTAYFNFKVSIRVQRFNTSTPPFCRVFSCFFSFIKCIFAGAASARMPAFLAVQMKKQRFACDKQEEGEIGKAILVTAF